MGLDRFCPIRSLTTNVVSSERGFASDLVGQLFKDDASDGVFKLVYCLDGDCTAGRVVMVDVSASSANGSVAVEACDTHSLPLGVASCTFASASFGLVQVSGLCSTVVQGTGTTITPGDMVTVSSATAGLVVPADLTTSSGGAAGRIVGQCITSASDSGEALVLFLKGVL